MRILFMLTGIPGSGKSYDIKKLQLEHLTISTDTLRVMNGTLLPYINKSSNIDNFYDNIIFEQLIQMLENRMIYGQTTILDTTGLYNINNILDLAKAYRYRVVYVVYDKYSIDECYNNICSRKYNNSISYDVLIKYQARLIEFKKKHKDYETDLYSAVAKWDTFYLQQDTFNQYEDIIVIPDLHGSYTVFSKFLEDNDMLQNTEKAYIFLGDYIDRGEDNISMIESLIWLASLKNVYLIRGNHDLRLFNWAFDKPYGGNNFKKTIKEIEKKKSEKEIENIKKSLRKISNKIKDYIYFEFNGQKYFLNHAGIEYMDNHFPACFLNGKKTYGYKEDSDTYESYIQVAGIWQINHPDIIQIFGHRNCFPDRLENGIKINNNAYCLECNVEYGDPLIVFSLKDKAVKMYDNPAKKSKKIENNLKDVIQEKEFIEHNIKSINFTKNVFHKRIWNDVTIKARGLYKYIDSNEIAGRGYIKFFNINEKEDTKIENWVKDIEYPVYVYKKYNGFLGIVFYNKTIKDLEYATKSTAYGKKYNIYIEELLNKEQKEYIKEISKKHNVTFLFECIHLKDNEHPVKAEKSEIILLDIVENTEDLFYKNGLAGNLFNRKELIDTIYNENDLLKTADYYNNSLDIDIEGVVLQDKNNKMLKIKTIYYKTKKLIRAVSYTNNIKVIENPYYPVMAKSLAFLAANDLIRKNKLYKWNNITLNDLKEYYKTLKL